MASLEKNRATDRTKERTIINVVMTTLVTLLLTQRIGVSVGGFPFALAILIIPAALAYLFAKRCIAVDLAAASFYFLLTLITTLGFFTSDSAKPTALFIFLFLYFPFIFYAPLSEEGRKRVVRRITVVLSIFAIIGIVQFLLQFVFSPPWLFTWRSIVPPTFLIEYNTLNRLFYGSTIAKSNGFFLLEPSQFGQLAARNVALIINYAAPVWTLAASATGLLLSYSGTGFMVVTAFLASYIALKPQLLARKELFYILGAGLLIAVVVMLFGDALQLSRYSARSGEFSTRNTSGYQRFITPFNGVFRSNASTVELLLGRGAGSSIEGLSQQGLIALPTTWAKIAYEYGLLGLTMFTMIVALAARRAHGLGALFIMFLFQFLVIDAAAGTPQLCFLHFMLCGFFGVSGRRQNSPVSS